MSSLVNTCEYGAINTTDTKTMGYSVIKYVSEIFTLQEETAIDGQASKSTKLAV